MPFLASERCFWPLPAFMRSEVKKNCAHVLPYTILNKSHEINFSIGCMVRPLTLLSVRQDILGLLMRCYLLVSQEILTLPKNSRNFDKIDLQLLILKVCCDCSRIKAPLFRFSIQFLFCNRLHSELI